MKIEITENDRRYKLEIRVQTTIADREKSSKSRLVHNYVGLVTPISIIKTNPHRVSGNTFEEVVQKAVEWIYT